MTRLTLNEAREIAQKMLDAAGHKRGYDLKVGRRPGADLYAVYWTVDRQHKFLGWKYWRKELRFLSCGDTVEEALASLETWLRSISSRDERLSKLADRYRQGTFYVRSCV